MLGRDALLKRLNGKAEIIFGDIRDTVGSFRETVDPTCPLGFVSIELRSSDGTTRCTCATYSIIGPEINPRIEKPSVCPSI